jgi:hypothetical protein
MNLLNLIYRLPVSIIIWENKHLTIITTSFDVICHTCVHNVKNVEIINFCLVLVLTHQLCV